MITHSPNNKPIPKYIRIEVLDEIREEIENMEVNYDCSLFDDKRTDMEKCKDWFRMYRILILQIIDKYKAESEGENEKI